MNTLRKALIEATPAILTHLRVTGYLPFSEFSDGPSSMLTLEAFGCYNIAEFTPAANALLAAFIPRFSSDAWSREYGRYWHERKSASYRAMPRMEGPYDHTP